MKKDKIIRIDSDLPTIIPNVNRVADFIKFAEWSATPTDKKEQKTQAEFAKTIGIDPDSLCLWKKHPWFWPIVCQLMSEWVKERIPDVLNGLYSNACGEGKAREVEAFIKLGVRGIDADIKKDKKTNN